MIKEGLLFVVSTGVLIYFISPGSEESEPATDKREQVESIPAPKSSDDADDDDGWGDEDDEAEEEEYVFGEPMVSDDDGDDDYNEDAKEEDSGEGGWGSSSSSRDKSGDKEVATDSKERSGNPNSPKGGQRGSRENPIVFKTNNPEDPEDD